jgi:streptogramin lyase
MQRRTLIKVGVATGALLAAAGGTLALLQPARVAGRLSAPAQAVLAALARSVLGGLWPADREREAEAVTALVGRFEATVAGLSPGQQAEVDELLTIAGSAPGRIALFGLASAWAQADVEQVTASLQSMRLSRLALRQQAFHAVRDLINAAWFADASTWAAIGYPGPRTTPSTAATPS